MPCSTEILYETSRGNNRTLMSLINLGEIVYITERERGLAKAQEVLAVIEQLAIEILPVDRQTMLAAAHLKAYYPVADADAFVIATARANDGVLLAGDPEYEAVKDIVRIGW
ncbi:MAG: type II toxin-antitoxin system VapC family toxin [Anaerolineales bacterium]